MSLYDKLQEFYNRFKPNYSYEFLGNLFEIFQTKDCTSQYFIYDGENMIISPFIKETEPINNIHTISTFFLGLLIKQKLFPELEIKSERCNKYGFSYLWFLVCIFHDIGYLQERDWSFKYTYAKKTKEYLQAYQCAKKETKELRYTYEDLGVLFVAPSLFQSKQYSKASVTESNEDNYGIRFNNGIEIKRAVYSRSTILHYLEYCKMEDNIRCYDHGIIGGLWLYDCMMKNYNMQYQKVKQHGRSIFYEDFWSDDKQHFSIEQKKIFAYLADCVISHNMQPADIHTNEKYKKCGLDELTKEKFQKIGFTDNPILFILILADAVEPVETYESYLPDIKEILSAIDIHFTKDHMVIKGLDGRLPFDRMANKVKAVEKRLKVNVTMDENAQKIEVKF